MPFLSAGAPAYRHRVAKPRRLRVLGDRLWDDEGNEWFNPLGQWADSAGAARALATAGRCVTHGHGRAFRVLDRDAARRYWLHASKHFEVPGGAGPTAEPDADGITFAAQVWIRGDEVLVGFVEFC